MNMKNKIIIIAIFLYSLMMQAQTKSWGNSKIKIGTIPAVTAVDSILVPSATGLVQHITYSNFFAKLHQDLLDAGLGGGGTALTFTLPISVTNDVVSMTQAGAAQNGWISSVDFNTFNNKVSFPGFTSLLTDYSFTDNSTNWNTAFGWGDHSIAGYSIGAHTIDTDTQLNESQVDAFVANNNYETTSARTYLPAGAYTTNTTQTGMSVDMLLGSVITLDDANVNVGDYFNFYNNTGADITWQFGASDTAIEGALSNLPDKKHGFARLVAANSWTVIDGASATGGEPLWLAEEINVPRLDANNIFTGVINAFNSGAIYFGKPTGTNLFLANSISSTTTNLLTNDTEFIMTTVLDMVIDANAVRVAPSDSRLTIDGGLSQVALVHFTTSGLPSSTYIGAEFGNFGIFYDNLNVLRLTDTNVEFPNLSDAEIDATGATSAVTKGWVEAQGFGGGSGWATTGTTVVTNPIISGAVEFDSDFIVTKGINTAMDFADESPNTSNVYFLSAPNNVSGHILNSDGTLTGLGHPVVNVAAAENLYSSVGVYDTSETSDFSYATTSGVDNDWFDCAHATVDITVTLDSGVAGRVAFFSQEDAAQIIFVAGTGVTLQYPVSITTPKTKEEGSVVGALWKTATLIQLVGGLE